MPVTKPMQIVVGVFALATVAAAALLTQPGMKEPPPAAPAAQPGEKKPEPKPADTIRFGVKQAPAKTPGAIRITTFNIENMFDDKDDPKLSGTFEDKNSTKPAEQLKAAADAIRLIDSDVLCLEEVESEEAVKWFRDGWLKGMGYDYIASVDAGDPRGIEQAVLSRFPIKNVRTYTHKNLGGAQPEKWGRGEANNEAGKPFEFKRSPLQVTIEVPNTSVADLLKKAGKAEARAEAYEFTLFVVHLKSGRDYDLQRAAEAKGVIALAEAVTKEKPSANVLVLGDCNALLNQNALKPFEAAHMHSIWEGRNPQDRATMTHTTSRCIDHIFYNTNVKAELVLPSRFVLGMPARAENADFRTTPPPAGYASDHYPVSVDLVPVESTAPAK